MYHLQVTSCVKGKLGTLGEHLSRTVNLSTDLPLNASSLNVVMYWYAPPCDLLDASVKWSDDFMTVIFGILPVIFGHAFTCDLSKSSVKCFDECTKTVLSTLYISSDLWTCISIPVSCDFLFCCCCCRNWKFLKVLLWSFYSVQTIYISLITRDTVPVWLI